MKGGEHQVTGEGGFDGGLGRFDITGFADQEHIRVLTHESPKSHAEVVTLFTINLSLGDAP